MTIPNRPRSRGSVRQRPRPSQRFEKALSPTTERQTILDPGPNAALRIVQVEVSQSTPDRRRIAEVYFGTAPTIFTRDEKALDVIPVRSGGAGATRRYLSDQQPTGQQGEVLSLRWRSRPQHVHRAVIEYVLEPTLGTVQEESAPPPSLPLPPVMTGDDVDPAPDPVGPTPPLSAVRNLRTTGVTKTSGTVRWDKPANDGGSNITGYQVRIFNLRWGGSQTGTSRSYRGLTAGTHLHIHVRPVTANGYGPEAFIILSTKPDKPGPVTQLFARDVGREHYEAQWYPPLRDNGAPILNYQYRATGIGGISWRQTNSPFRQRISGLQPNTAYWIEVRALNEAGPGPATRLNVTTNPRPEDVVVRTTPPSQVTQLEVTAVTNNAYSIEWHPPANNGGAPLIKYETRATGIGAYRWISVAPPLNHAHTVTGLSPSTQYSIQVRAVNDAGNGPVNTLVIQTLPDPVDPPDTGPETGHPHSVQDLRIDGAVTDQGFTLSWQAPSNDGGAEITGYEWRSTNIGDFRWRSADDTPDAQGRFQLDFGPWHRQQGHPPGPTYRVDVRAVNANGAGPFARYIITLPTPATPNPVQPAPTPEERPGPVTNLETRGLITFFGTLFAWMAPATGGDVDKYQWRSTSIGDYSWRDSHDTEADGTGRFYLDFTTVVAANGYPPGETYRVDVRAVNGAGAGAYSRITITLPTE